ncbi:Hypothetical predicted protein [Paramuricea clavata]|uniref:Uncharacterized protein n=1 Tax=Paramuricea clavata TaxID=317549 RepID=A0A6S7IIM8_PARCT|nr:Hypothetical predicted protein [Paramuricea clavata]
MEKAAFLATSLKGTALQVLANLSNDRKQDYRALVTALASRFGTSHRTEISKVKFKNRVRQRDEGLPALAEDIERLARLAYADAPPTITDTLARDQFVDSLPDDDMRLRLRPERPQTLQRALELALELESFHLANLQQRMRVSRETKVQSEFTPRGTTTSTLDIAKRMEAASNQIAQSMKKLEALMRDLDTGSNITIVRPDVIELRSGKILPTETVLRTVTGETAPVRGRDKLNITVGNSETEHDVWIADMVEEGIIGLNYLMANNCQVNLAGKLLLVGDDEVPLVGQVRPVKGTEIATCEPVACVRNLEHQPSKEEDSATIHKDKGGDRELPEHLVDLYRRSKTFIGEGHKTQLIELLKEFQDMFSSGPNYLGSTSITTHKINVGEAIPVKQRPRRLPIKQREEANKTKQVN